MEELLSLKWNNHKSTFLQVLKVLRDKHLYTDVTIACDGKFYSVHKLVLSTCSDYFSAILDRTNCKNPVIVLKDIKNDDLEALLDYMYLGEVNVRQCDLATLIKAAECLRVKGLAVPDDEPPPPTTKKTPRESAPKRTDSSSSPPAKRKRRSELEEVKDELRLNHVSVPRPKISPVVDNNVNKSTSDSVVDNSVNTSENKEQNRNSRESDISDIQELPQVKIENESSQVENEDSFDINSEQFKEENEMSSDLPDFLQEYSHNNFSGPSYQSEMPWPDGGGDGSQSAAGSAFSPSSLHFANLSPNDQSSHQQGSGPKNLPTGTPSNQGGYCPFCPHVTSGRNWRQDLKRHMCKHTGEKPFACPYCDHRTTRTTSLKWHIMKSHFADSGGSHLAGSDIHKPPEQQTPQ